MTTLEEHLLAGERFLASGGVVMRNTAGEVLVLRTTYKESWEIPGGLVDRGEGPHAAAAREVREELGVDLAVGRLLCVDYRTPWEENPHPMLHFVFDGGVLNEPTFTLQQDEIAEALFLPPEEAARQTGARVGTRLVAALRSIERGGAVHLTEGEEV
jgi:8-oxo-dGTP diphosphatase